MTLVRLVGAHKLHLQHTCPPTTHEIFSTTHVGNSCPWCVASCSCPCPPLLLTTLTRVPNNRNRLKIYQSWSVGSFCGPVGRCKCVCVRVCVCPVCLFRLGGVPSNIPFVVRRRDFLQATVFGTSCVAAKRNCRLPQEWEKLNPRGSKEEEEKNV